MATVLLDFNRIQILTPEQNEKVFQELLGARNVWLRRNNWHPAIEIAGPDSGIEDYVHYSTVGATLYMDARDRGWKLYGKLRDMYNRLLWNRLGWLYDTFLEQIQNEIGDAEYDSGLADEAITAGIENHLKDCKACTDTLGQVRKIGEIVDARMSEPITDAFMEQHKDALERILLQAHPVGHRQPVWRSCRR